MNDLVTPFFLVFLQEAVPVQAWQDLENYDVASLSKEQRDIIEADSFWCLSKFLDGIQDNYIFAQLGIQHKVNQLKELIQRIDGEYPDAGLISVACTHFSGTRFFQHRCISTYISTGWIICNFLSGG